MERRRPLCHLKASLEGNAASLLWELPSDCSEKELLGKLRNRFGDQEQIERFRAQLRSRRRQKGESLQHLYQDVCRLLALSYPGETGTLSHIVARDAFLDSLDDPELRIKVLERDATNIEQAYTIVARFEAFSERVNCSSEERKRVRAVKPSSDSVSTGQGLQKMMDKMDHVIAGLQSVIQQQQQQQQQLAMCQPPMMPMFHSTAVPATWPGDPRNSAAMVEQAPPLSCTVMPPSVLAPVDKVTEKSRPRNTRGPCYKCHSMGHYAKQCPTNEPSSTSSEAVPLRAVLNGIEDSSQVYLPAKICKGSKVLHICVVLDSGCAVSVCPANLVTTGQQCDVKLSAANGSQINVTGKAHVDFIVNGVKLHADVLCSDSIDEFLLGADWLKENKCLWNFASSEVTIQGRVFKLQSRKSSSQVRRVYVSDDVLVQKHSVTDIPVTLKYASLHCQPSNWILEPRVIEGQLIAPRSLLSNDEQAMVRVINPFDKDVMVHRKLCLGTAEPIRFLCVTCGPVCYCVPSDKQAEAGLPVRSVEPVNGAARPVDVTNVIVDNNLLIKPMMDSLPDCVAAEQRMQVESLLLQYVDIFARHEYDVGCTGLVQHKLQLKDASLPPVRETLRRHPIAYLDLIDREVGKLLSAGLVVPCQSAVVQQCGTCPKKPNAPGEKAGTRICLDFRNLNQRLVNSNFPVGETSTVINSLQGAKFFQTLDLANAYLGMQLDPETSDLTAFITRKGQFKFTRLSRRTQAREFSLRSLSESNSGQFAMV
jgi:hypothetical protein